MKLRRSGPGASDVDEPEAEADQSEAGQPAAAKERTKTPLYPRLLRLRHVAPNAWQRAVLGEGALGVAVLLVLADLATAWTLLALPLAVAVVVKAHDGLAGLLARPPREHPSGGERPSEGERPPSRTGSDA